MIPHFSLATVQIGAFAVSTHALAFTAAVLLWVAAGAVQCRRLDLPLSPLFDMAPWVILCGIMGGHLAASGISNTSTAIALWRGQSWTGAMFAGGAAAALILIVDHRYGHRWQYLNVLMFGFQIALAGAKVGCLLLIQQF
jgi:hypothetical protein